MLVTGNNQLTHSEVIRRIAIDKGIGGVLYGNPGAMPEVFNNKLESTKVLKPIELLSERDMCFRIGLQLGGKNAYKKKAPERMPASALSERDKKQLAAAKNTNKIHSFFSMVPSPSLTLTTTTTQQPEELDMKLKKEEPLATRTLIDSLNFEIEFPSGVTVPNSHRVYAHVLFQEVQAVYVTGLDINLEQIQDQLKLDKGLLRIKDRLDMWINIFLRRQYLKSKFSNAPCVTIPLYLFSEKHRALGFYWKKEGSDTMLCAEEVALLDMVTSRDDGPFHFVIFPSGKLTNSPEERKAVENLLNLIQRNSKRFK